MSDFEKKVIDALEGIESALFWLILVLVFIFTLGCFIYNKVYS